MADTIKVWPAPGVTIRHEFTGEPIKAGEEVPLTRLTHRRIVRGELLEEPPREGEAKSGTHAERFDESSDRERG